MNQGSFSLKYGLIIALLLIVIDVLLHMLALDLKPGFSSIDTVVLVASIIIACTLFSKANSGYVTFGQVFLTGFFTTLIVAGALAVWTVLKFSIWPDLGAQIREMTNAEMERRGRAPSDNERQFVGKVTDIVTSPAVMAVIAFFSYLITGTIAALIGGAVAKKSSTPRPDILDDYGSPKR